MHVQVKSQQAPPEGIGGRLNGWVIHDAFRAKPLDAGETEWLYEPIAHRDTEALVLQLPDWLASQDYRIYVHDTESRAGTHATILCSTEGRPLAPYYLPTQQQAGIPNALFSLPFDYIRINFNGAIHHLEIDLITPKQQEIEGFIYATADMNTLFSGSVKTETTFCRTCKTEFDLEDLRLHARHVILPSTFSIDAELRHLDKAIRAAYKKARAPKVNRVFYVATKK